MLHVLLTYFRLFNAMDQNGDGYLTASELRALVLGIQFDQINLNHDDAVAKVMKDFDKSADNQIDLQEFIGGIAEWLEDVNKSKASSLVTGSETIKYLNDYHKVRDVSSPPLFYVYIFFLITVSVLATLK